MQQEGKQTDLNANEIVEQGSLVTPDEVHRNIRRGDETKGDPNSRDVAGSVKSNETPQGREEAKNDRRGVVNDNG